MSFKESLNLKEAARNKLLNEPIEYLFRKKYNIPPKDPRFLNCETWEMELDLEMDSIYNEILESHQKICPNCKKIVIGKFCKDCGEEAVKEEKYFDPDFDEAFKDIEKENEEYFSNQKWVDVSDKDLDSLEKELDN